MVCGERASLDVLGPSIESNKHIVFVNMYGPSESTIFATEFYIPSDCRRANIPIGRSLPNNGAYVIDEALNLVPPGVCGELLLTGASLARGYLNQPDLTKEKFITLKSSRSLGSLRGYRTGDLVRQLACGDLEFLRRKDDGQVKLRGQRLELGEIEETIKQHAGVGDAVAVLCKRNGINDQLVAYFTTLAPAEYAEQQTREIRELLQARLPTYMVPSLIFCMPTFVLSRTGKIDRKTMASPEFVDQIADEIRSSLPSEPAMLTPHERLVRKVFTEALGMKEELLGGHDNFFDVGGHSLIAVRIVSSIRRVFSISLPMPIFMNNATVCAISKIISHGQVETEQSSLPSIPHAAASKMEFPASHMQVSLWAEEQMNHGLSTYNTGFQRRTSGPLNLDALQKAFIALVVQHDALRTRFSMRDDLLIQQVQSLTSTSELIQIAQAEDEQAARMMLSVEAARLFDLSKDLPVRFLIVRVSAEVHFISMITHHIVTDGWSFGVIDHDLTVLYNTFLTDIHQQSPLSPLSIRYGEICAWQNQLVDSGVFAPQLAYWVEELKGAKPLELFTDYPRPQKLSGRADEIPFTMDDTMVSSLRRLASTHQTSLYVVLLAAFRAAIYRANGEEDGMLGMVSANRPTPEMEGVVGYFVNPRALRLEVTPDSTFESLVQTTRKVVIDSLQHLDVPFQQIVSELAPQRNVARKPLVQLGALSIVAFAIYMIN